ncbi:DUF2690 domain-containing protein [Paractinoplanes lichenicola]|uniref:DUF2690 domain-containing protein n=1 Tax=Paractinoplanes lichenicola TaxID=2802976 RepID=A0ABS1VIT5_9ACTN|nr:DUF2690 domain-containing protein [Actinoplanes lichenicola]MBL7254205.1 DUF2690 domain-containing protein [Actinoplanes lichenicola]
MKTRRFKKPLHLSLALTVAATAFTVAAAAPASAATECRGSACNGIDPAETPCGADAGNIDSFHYSGTNEWLQGALMELRRSSACDAAWARVTGGDCMPPWRDCGFVLEVSGDSAQLGSNPRAGQHWTPMWSFRSYVRGCFVTYEMNPDAEYTRDQCTAWR